MRDVPNFLIIVFMSLIMLIAMATQDALVILLMGIVVVFFASEADVSYSTDHPLVKTQGLPL